VYQRDFNIILSAVLQPAAVPAPGALLLGIVGCAGAFVFQGLHKRHAA